MTEQLLQPNDTLKQKKHLSYKRKTLFKIYNLVRQLPLQKSQTDKLLIGKQHDY